MVVEGVLTYGSEHTIQYTEMMYYRNETNIILFTKVTPIN